VWAPEKPCDRMQQWNGGTVRDCDRNANWEKRVLTPSHVVFLHGMVAVVNECGCDSQDRSGSQDDAVAMNLSLGIGLGMFSDEGRGVSPDGVGGHLE